MTLYFDVISGFPSKMASEQLEGLDWQSDLMASQSGDPDHQTRVGLSGYIGRLPANGYRLTVTG